MKRRSITIAVLGTLLWFFSSQFSEACTLWGAIGHSVEGGGTMIAKNRDWAPGQRHELAVLKPAGGFNFLVLKAVGGAEPGVIAGVNEKGLVIVSATADQVASEERKKFSRKKG